MNDWKRAGFLRGTPFRLAFGLKAAALGFILYKFTKAKGHLDFQVGLWPPGRALQPTKSFPILPCNPRRMAR
jgi:hypothetical protein